MWFLENTVDTMYNFYLLVDLFRYLVEPKSIL